MTQGSPPVSLFPRARDRAANSENAWVNSPAPATALLEHQLPFISSITRLTKSSSMERMAALTANLSQSSATTSIVCLAVSSLIRSARLLAMIARGSTRLFERASDLCANLSCILCGGPQLGLQELGLNAEGFLKILGLKSFSTNSRLAATCRSMYALKVPICCS